tara:strand:- start:1098 stop:1610 length:513 start_codon:yes stop_codon:yes gene_type:complete
MRPEKQFLTDEYTERLNQSPFFIVTDYTGLNVAEFESLRSKLREGNAEIHVVKNSVFRAAATQAGIGDLNGALTGQIAIVTGDQEISSAAKVVKEFAEKPNKPKIRFGYVGEERLDEEVVLRIADLPSIEVLRAQLLGVIQAPATQLARVINTPASMVARAIQAHVDKGE